MNTDYAYVQGVQDGLAYGVGFLIGSAASARELGKHDLAEVFTAAADELRSVEPIRAAHATQGAGGGGVKLVGRHSTPASADELVGCSTVPGAQHCNALMDDGDTEHACCLGADHDDAAHECDCGVSWP